MLARARGLRGLWRPRDAPPSAALWCGISSSPPSDGVWYYRLSIVTSGNPTEVLAPMVASAACPLPRAWAPIAQPPSTSARPKPIFAGVGVSLAPSSEAKSATASARGADTRSRALARGEISGTRNGALALRARNDVERDMHHVEPQPTDGVEDGRIRLQLPEVKVTEPARLDIILILQL
jgi:hypothetical protein